MSKDLFKNIKGVFFDLDGTLMDSMWLWKTIDIEYLQKFDIEYKEGLQEEIAGKSFHETAVLFKKLFNIEDSIEKMKSDWNDMALYKYEHEVPLKKGAKQLLDLLKEKGIKVAIGTSNSVELTKAALKANGLENYFDICLTGSEIINGKPDPYIYLECAKRSGLNPKDCLVFEDIVSGIKAGKNAGMKVVAIDDDFSFYERKEKIKLADLIIKDFTEVINEF